MSEIRNGVDPSKLHLKKELTAIRKAARVLRDPGTTSSWRSPLSSSRSLANAAVHAQPFSPSSTAAAAAAAAAPVVSTSNGKSHNIKNSESPSQLPPQINENGNGKEKRRVFLYNWKTQRSSSEKSMADPVAKRGEDDNEGSVLGSGSAEDSLSDARNGGDSKSDTYIGDRRSSMLFRCRDTSIGSLVTPSMRRAMATKKSRKKGTHSAALLSNHQRQQRMLLGAKKSDNSKRLLEGSSSIPSGLGIADSVESSEDYSMSEDLHRVSEVSPLFSRSRQGNWPQSSSKLLRSRRKEDSSYTYSTPALSTSSYNRYRTKNPSTVGSWDGTTASYNDGDDEVDDHLDLPGRQGCGIPCYWSKRTPKHRGVCGSCYSPSLSDTLMRKGSSILCGSQTVYNRRRRSSTSSNKRRMVLRSAQGVLPLLSDSYDGRGGSSIGTGRSDDELSTNFGELDLEALSRLDGRRWSSCRSQEGLEIVALNGEGEEEGTPDNMKSMSQKYRPMFFEELIGQNIVVQSLMNAITRGRIAPVYLFQGPRGTGKTSTARIFAAALNCLSTEETKPCGYCRECVDFISGNNRYLREVDSTNKKGIDSIRYLLKNLPMRPPSTYSPYKVFAIDECHLLPSKTWLAFLKFLENPPPRVAFIFLTTDLDNVPRAVLSRCQKYLFNKIKDGDIVTRLTKIATDESLDVESDALDLIALNADGSLRDAETMLDQLSLLGKRITASLVNELVGVVSDEKLLELLELAMSSDTAETVKRARDLMDSGADPMVLMSQLASLIMDIIAGSYQHVDAKFDDSFFGGQSLSEAELEKLKHALKLLSEAEKQLRVSSERSTWFTATLLQLGSAPSPDLTLSSSSRRQSSRTTEEDPSSTSKEASALKQMSDGHYVSQKLTSPASLPKTAIDNSTRQRGVLSLVDGFSSKPIHTRLMEFGASASSHDDLMFRNMIYRSISSGKLDDIWSRCIDRCHSKTLRQLLCTHGKLVSISQVEGALVAYIAFGNGDIKSRAERFLSSITNSFEIVLRCNVEIRIILLPNGETFMNSAKSDELPDALFRKQIETTFANDRGSFSDLEGKRQGGTQDHFSSSTKGSSVVLAERNSEVSGNGKKPELPMQRIESIIREQRLETAWLQATERSTPGSMSRLKPEKNQVLPQDGIFHHDQTESMSSMRMSSQHWEDDLNHELKVLKINEGALKKDQTTKRSEHYPMSPSILHDSSFVGNFSKETPGYESGSGTGGCSGLLCWNNNTKPHKRGKVKQGTPVGPHRSGRFLLFGDCGKAKKTGNSRGRR